MVQCNKLSLCTETCSLLQMSLAHFFWDVEDMGDFSDNVAKVTSVPQAVLKVYFKSTFFVIFFWVSGDIIDKLPE